MSLVTTYLAAGSGCVDVWARDWQWPQARSCKVKALQVSAAAGVFVRADSLQLHVRSHPSSRSQRLTVAHALTTPLSWQPRSRAHRAGGSWCHHVVTPSLPTQLRPCWRHLHTAMKGLCRMQLQYRETLNGLTARTRLSDLLLHAHRTASVQLIQLHSGAQAVLPPCK